MIPVSCIVLLYSVVGVHGETYVDDNILRLHCVRQHHSLGLGEEVLLLDKGGEEAAD